MMPRLSLRVRLVRHLLPRTLTYSPTRPSPPPPHTHTHTHTEHLAEVLALPPPPHTHTTVTEHLKIHLASPPPTHTHQTNEQLALPPHPPSSPHPGRSSVRPRVSPRA